LLLLRLIANMHFKGRKKCDVLDIKKKMKCDVCFLEGRKKNVMLISKLKAVKINKLVFLTELKSFK